MMATSQNDQVEDEIVTQGSLQNASLLNVLENKFASLEGRKSDYLKTLSTSEKQVLLALKNLNKKNEELEREKFRQIHEVEKKFQIQHELVNKNRKEFILGEKKPTAEDYKRTEDETFQDVQEMGELSGSSSEKEVNGIPEFWLTCLKNLPPLQDLITESDEACLKHLIDIRVVYLENNPGFTLEFEFEENEFFTNKVLTKSYYLNDERIELVYDHAVGCDIDWKEEKNLNFKIEIKKQRHKASNKTRTVKKAIPCDTFFTFFNTVAPLDDDEEIDEDVMEMLEMDYERGEIIKEKLVNNAVNWFTGEALAEFEEEYGDEEDDDEYGDEYDEDEDDEDDDEEGPAEGATSQAPECKQQ